MNAIDDHENLAGDTAEFGESRSPHPLAVATLVLGLLSFLALFSTMFWIVPLVTLIFGVIALWSLAASSERIGRRAALCGMTLALLFGAWAPCRYFSRNAWLVGQARAYADDWLELVRQKKLQEAHQLHGRGNQRAAEGTSLEEFYRNDSQGEGDYQMFFAREPLSTFVELPGPVQVEFKKIDLLLSYQGSDSVVLCYDVMYDRDGRQAVLPMRVVLKREPEFETGDFQWFVEGVQ